MGGWGGLFTPSQHLVPFSRQMETESGQEEGRGGVFRLAGSTPLSAPLHIIVNSCMLLPLVVSDECHGLVKFSVEAWEQFVSKLNRTTERLHASTLSVNSLSSLRPRAFPFHTWVHLWSLSMMQTLQHPISATLAHFSIPLAVIHTLHGELNTIFHFSQ